MLSREATFCICCKLLAQFVQLSATVPRSTCPGFLPCLASSRLTQGKGPPFCSPCTSAPLQGQTAAAPKAGPNFNLKGWQAPLFAQLLCP